MAPRNHTTPEQLEWLNSLKPKFKDHQAKKNLSDFWAELERDWFSKWPEPGVAEAENEPEGHALCEKATEVLKHRKSYLKNWFNNRSVVGTRKAPITFQSQVPPTRSRQPLELFSHKCYNEKVKPLVEAELAKNDVPQNERLGVVKRLTKAVFDAEPEEVRDAIIKEADTLKLKNASQRAEARDSEVEPSLENYAEAIESVTTVVERFIEELGMRTGWAFSVMGGGPDPANGGEIEVISVHHGRNALGASFKRAHVSFKTGVLKPYMAFLNQVFPPSVCEARTLTNAQDPPNNPSPETTIENTSNDTSNPAHSDTQASAATSAIPESPSVEDMSYIDPQLRPSPSSTSSAPPVPCSSSALPTLAPLAIPAPPVSMAPPAAPGSSTPLDSSVPTSSATDSHVRASLTSPNSPIRTPSAHPAPPTPAPTIPPMPQTPQAPPTPSVTVVTPTLPNDPPMPPPLPVTATPTTPARITMTNARKSNGGKKAPMKPKPRKRPGVQPASALQRAVENVIADTGSAQGGDTWSKELTGAVKRAEAKAAKTAQAKATRAAKAAAEQAENAAAEQTKNAAAEQVENTAAEESVEQAAAVMGQTILQQGRSQRIRKAATSKEVIPLTDKCKRSDAKENDSQPKKA